MNENKELIIRFLLIFFLIAAIIFTIIHSKNNQNDEKLDIVIKNKVELTYKMILFQVILAKQFPDENQKLIQEQIFQQITYISSTFKDEPLVHIQNYILYKHFSLNSNNQMEYIIPESIEDNKDYKPYIKMLKDIYETNKPPTNLDIENNTLNLPLHKIVIIDYYKLTEPEKAKDYLNSLVNMTLPFQLGISILTFLMFISFFIGFYVVLRFFIKTPVPFYGIFIRSFSNMQALSLLEASTIYLFLYISINFIIMKLFKDYITNPIWFQIFYMIIIFIFSLYYLKIEIGEKNFLYTFWTRVYSNKDLNHFINIEGLETLSNNKKQDEDLEDTVEVNENKNILDSLKKHIKEKNIQPNSPLKEIFYGIFAFIVIFPLSFVILLLSMIFTGNQISINDAHPISFLIPDRLLEVMILAIVLAPIIEEVVFRNWIYGFFRSRYSMLLSSFFSGVIFASLHPQGIIAFPYLVFLGMALSILREYRPGIIAPIVTHMCVNGLAVGMSYLFYKLIVF